MLVWNRERLHRFLPPDDREYYIYEMSIDNSYKWIKFFSIIINIAVPFTLYYLYGINLIVFGICFIGLDILLNLIEQLAFITMPYLFSKIKSAGYLTFKIERIKKRKAKVEDKIYHLRKKYCQDCDRTWNTNDCCKCKEMRKLVEKKNELNDLIRQEEKFLKNSVTKKEKKVENKVVEEKVTKDTNIIDVQENKDYFNKVADVLNEFINKEHFDCLIALRKSAKSMSQVLKDKPNGKSIIPISIYTKIDNIVVLLGKIAELEKSERTQYLDEIKEISKDVSDEMQKVIINVNKIGKEEPKNEIDTLLKELMNKEEK